MNQGLNNNEHLHHKVILFLISALVFIFLIRFLISLKDFNFDIFNHIHWTESMLKEGLKGFYSRDYSPWASANYPPLSNLFFLLSHKFYLLLPSNWQLNNLLTSFYKLPVLISDMIIAVSLFKIGVEKGRLKKGVFFALLFLLNISLVYNSIFWGQLESLMTMFCLLSLIFFYHRSKIFAFIFFALALLIKQSALFFLPIFLILVIKKTGSKEKIIGFSLIYLLIVFFFSFFIYRGYFVYPFSFYLKTMGGQAHQYLASVNALNFWYLLGLNKVADNNTFFYITFRAWSIILTSLLIIPPLVLCFLKTSFKRSLYTLFILSFTAFLFLTRMHERHLYPALVFLIPFVTSFKNLWLYIIVSIIHFLNLYIVWQSFLNPPSFLINLFKTSDKFLSLLTIIIFGYYYLSYFIKVSKKQL